MTVAVPRSWLLARGVPGVRFTGLTLTAGVARTRTVYAWLAVKPELSRARTVKENNPRAVGVPLSVPLGSRVRPSGRDPAETEKVNEVAPASVAWMVWLSPVPYSPFGTGGVVMGSACTS